MTDNCPPLTGNHRLPGLHTQAPRTAMRIWSGLLNLGFGLLCLRYLIATGRESDWTAAMLCGVSFLLGWWRPAAGLLAIVLSVPLIHGLELTVLSVPYSAILVITSSLWLGMSARKLFPATKVDGTRSQSVAPTNLSANWIDLIVDVLATTALISMYAQIWRHGDAPAFLQRILPRTSSLASDASYFLPGFLWLLGLFYFRALRGSDAVKPAGIKLVFAVTGVLLLFFAGVQWQLGFPYYWTPGFQSPYEDIATFGIMAACLMLSCLALIRRGAWYQSCLLGLAAILLASAVGASWSRGTWLATAVFLAVLTLLRFRRPVAILAFAILLGTAAFLNLDAEKFSLAGKPYLMRLMSLVHPADLRTMSAGRFDIYHEAFAMIRDRPWTGHGIGSFFGTAPNYTLASDPINHVPHFAHNIWLQMAAEQGVPVATLFISLVGWVFLRGLRCWVICRSLGNKGMTIPERTRADAHLVLALTLMLGAYLQANMTWEILLIHPTQPFFFWFLMAALLAMTEKTNTAIEPAAGMPTTVPAK